MKINPLVKPFLKWAGGKRYLVPKIKEIWPKAMMGVYYEPFLGGGAVLLSMQPKKARVNDVNWELINCYEVIRDCVDDLITLLNSFANEERFYYEIRDWDREAGYDSRSRIEKAARIIYLNKTCYNGLFRVNSQGQFNVPFGKYKDPNIVDTIVLRAVSNYLNGSEVTFSTMDFVDAVASATKGDFLYIDPPYDSEHDPASFTGYSINGFGKDQQYRLRSLIEDLNNRGCRFLLSNAKTSLTTLLYARYSIEEVEVPRPINSDASKRGKVEEILVRNYGRRTKTEQNKRGVEKIISGI